jgi:predicted anti-sigma-YlaC factor YlaD
MGPLKKIQYNCKKATFLIEKKLIGRITLREHIELRIHLFGCSVCRIYQKQTGKINEMVHQLFHSATNADTQLDDSFKKDLQDRIEEQLNKN